MWLWRVFDTAMDSWLTSNAFMSGFRVTTVTGSFRGQWGRNIPPNPNCLCFDQSGIHSEVWMGIEDLKTTQHQYLCSSGTGVLTCGGALPTVEFYRRRLHSQLPQEGALGLNLLSECRCPELSPPGLPESRKEWLNRAGGRCG